MLSLVDDDVGQGMSWDKSTSTLEERLSLDASHSGPTMVMKISKGFSMIPMRARSKQKEIMTTLHQTQREMLLAGQVLMAPSAMTVQAEGSLRW